MGFMTRGCRLAAIGVLALGLILVLGSRPSAAQSHTHVYLFRGLADVFSTGMDTLASELGRHGIEASSHSHTDWKTIANSIVADYKAGRVGPIVLVGHSLGADAVMEMADYLGDRSVPVALLVPFDGTQSFPVPANVSRMINFTQRDYARMRPGPGFRGSLTNVDLSGDKDIDHLNIDKVPRLHLRVIDAVQALGGGRQIAAPKPAGAGGSRPGEGAGKADGADKKDSARPERGIDNSLLGTPIIAAPERRSAPASAAAPAPPPAPAPPAAAPAPPPQKPVATPAPAAPVQIPD